MSYLIMILELVKLIIQIDSVVLQSSVRKLLSYATSINKVNNVYNDYIHSTNKRLFGFMKENKTVGCIGVEVHINFCEIKHIAVSPEERGNGVGSKLINYILEESSLKTVVAETDKDAVDFYRKFGFKVASLGEKYPGVERFFCEFTAN